MLFGKAVICFGQLFCRVPEQVFFLHHLFSRIDFGCLQIFYRTLCQGIEGSNGIHLRVEEFDTVWVFGISRKNIYNTAPNAYCPLDSIYAALS